MADKRRRQDAPPATQAQDDAALFRAAIGTVRELPEAADAPPRPRPAPVARMARRDEDEALEASRSPAPGDPLQAGDALRHRREGLPPRIWQRLKRGQFAVEDEIDLHRADLARAEAMLRDFLNEARRHGAGCVRIVHGKGLHSDPGAPALKNLVDGWLRRRADVVAFHSAPPGQGGTGAVLVLLARG